MEVAGKVSMGREIENAERADLETAESRAWKNMNIRVFPMLLNAEAFAGCRGTRGWKMSPFRARCFETEQQ